VEDLRYPTRPRLRVRGACRPACGTLPHPAGSSWPVPASLPDHEQDRRTRRDHRSHTHLHAPGSAQQTERQDPSRVRVVAQTSHATLGSRPRAGTSKQLRTRDRVPRNQSRATRTQIMGGREDPSRRPQTPRPRPRGSNSHGAASSATTHQVSTTLRSPPERAELASQLPVLNRAWRRRWPDRASDETRDRAGTDSPHSRSRP
jgi:hypothetical protein